MDHENSTTSTQLNSFCTTHSSVAPWKWNAGRAWDHHDSGGAARLSGLWTAVFLVFVALLLGAPTVSHACSLSPLSHPQAFPPEGAVVTASPILYEVDTLRNSSGQLIPLTDVTAGALFDAANPSSTQEALLLKQPVQPLPAGAYSVFLSSGIAGQRFTVGAPGSQDATPTITGADAALFIDQSLGGPSGCGEGTDSCEGVDTTYMEFEIDYSTPLSTYGVVIVTWTLDDAAQGTALLGVRPPDLPSNTFVSDFGTDVPFSTLRTCITITPVSTSGALGSPYDVGCIDPNDPSDPRVERFGNDDDGGCAATSNRALNSFLLYAVALAGILFRRKSRRGAIHANCGA